MARDWRYVKARRNTEVYFMRLSKWFDGLGKLGTATMAASALETAMRKREGETKHDSSRAAANWDINVGGVNPYGRKTNKLDPKNYGEKGVGQKGDDGKNAGAVRSKKRQKYGYKYNQGAPEPAPGGWLWDAIGVGKLGTKSVHLFNPIMFAIHRRENTARGKHTGKTYAENAFFSGDAFNGVLREKGAIKNDAQIAIFREIRRVKGEIKAGRFPDVGDK